MNTDPHTQRYGSDALVAANRRNYPIYHGDDFVFSYCEYYGDHDVSDMARMTANPAFSEGGLLCAGSRSHCRHHAGGQTGHMRVFDTMAPTGNTPNSTRVLQYAVTQGWESMAIRMKDIADDLGVSLVTVSKAFNNHSDVSAKTREHVLRRMKELNYQPSLHAQGLASGRSYIVGFIVPDLVHAFFSEVAKSVSGVLRAKGYGLVISSSDEDPEMEEQEIDQMIRRRVDALLLSSCQGNPGGLVRLAEQKIPYILVDRNFRRYKSNFVGTDDVLVGELATEHLIKIGRRRIAHIGGQTVSTSVDRLQGYRNALERYKLRIPSEYVVARPRSDESGDITGREAMERLLRLNPRPDAVFCYNDPAAVGAMNAILNAGLRVPEDIAIVGAGNIRYAESFRVPLTSVNVSSRTLGEAAGHLALKIMTSKKAREVKKIIVPPQLVVRQSTIGA